MEWRTENADGAMENENLFSEEMHGEGEIFIEREIAEASVEDEEDIESWGVYIQGKEKTLLGLFWDKELAALFMNSVKGSNVLEKVKAII